MIAPDDPRHGTYAGYIAHGKTRDYACLPCNRAATRFRKKGRLDAHRGQPRRIPLGDDAYQILITCTAAQLTRRGVANSTVFRLRKLGPDTMVRRATRDTILAAATTTPIGIQRRLRALAALGYSMRQVAAHMGSEYADNLRTLVARDTVNYVREPMAQAIVATYDDLAMRPAPNNRGSARARNRAAREGWASPMAWDDIDTDVEPQTPAAGPSEVDHAAVERILAGDYHLSCTPAEKTAVCFKWLALGRSLNELERHTGWQARRYTKGDAA